MYQSKPCLTRITAYVVALLGIQCISPLLVLAQQSTLPTPSSQNLITNLITSLTQPAKTQPAAQSRAGKQVHPLILPNPGLPGRRQSASSRGCGKKPSVEKPLIALIPATTISLTTKAHPTFFFYVPPTSAKAVEFALVDEKNFDRIYEHTFPITSKSGIISFRLPVSNKLQQLKIDKQYHWYFSLLCSDSEESDSEEAAEETYVDGWIQRVQPSPNLMSELKKASPQAQVAIYEKYGLWQDTLTSLAEQRRSRPNDIALSAQWASLLRKVGLAEIAQENLVQGGE